MIMKTYYELNLDRDFDKEELYPIGMLFMVDLDRVLKFPGYGRRWYRIIGWDTQKVNDQFIYFLWYNVKCETENGFLGHINLTHLQIEDILKQYTPEMKMIPTNKDTDK